MKIAVIGIGAVGSIIARELKRTKHTVTLLGRKEKRGFTILEQDEKIHYPYTIENINTYDKETFDVVFIAAKATALRDISQTIPELTHKNTEIILCQNGMGFDGWFRNNIPAVVYISGQKHENMVEHFQDSKLIINDKPYKYLDKLLNETDQTALEIIKSDAFEKLRHEKLLINLGINTMTALSANTAKIFDKDNVTALTERLLEEGIQIVNRQEHIIDDGFKDKAISIYKNYNREMGTSMYYDAIAKKETEFEFIQKYLHGVKGDVKTPVLDIMVTLLEAYQYER